MTCTQKTFSWPFWAITAGIVLLSLAGIGDTETWAVVGLVLVLSIGGKGCTRMWRNVGKRKHDGEKPKRRETIETADGDVLEVIDDGDADGTF